MDPSCCHPHSFEILFIVCLLLNRFFFSRSFPGIYFIRDSLIPPLVFPMGKKLSAGCSPPPDDDDGRVPERDE